MSEIGGDEYEDISYDPHQDRPTQGTLAGESPVRKTWAKIYTDSPQVRGKRGDDARRRCCHATTRPKDEISYRLVTFRGLTAVRPPRRTMSYAS